MDGWMDGERGRGAVPRRGLFNAEGRTRGAARGGVCTCSRPGRDADVRGGRGPAHIAAWAKGEGGGGGVCVIGGSRLLKI